MLALGCSDLRDPVPTNSSATLNVHPADWVTVGSGDFHGVFIRNDGWQLANCQGCHGQSYDGGIANSSCLTCHPATPEDCTVCHGDATSGSPAPPEDLDGNTEATARGVGAHAAHLSAGDFAAGFACETCHLVPQSLYATGHVDGDDVAEVLFSGLAAGDGAQPQWAASPGSCQDSYCHGNWELLKSEANFDFVYSSEQMTGNNASPEWTNPEGAICGSCHGLPPIGHNPFELDACANCHGSVVDGTGSIVDKTKHVNGLLNVFGQEFPFPSGSTTKLKM
ncbi:hypothetical protein MJD09_15915 [bacterium]|nr:hypothetical protein [bacterium]